ncbi:hypothetical protein ACK6D9_19235 [Hoeflea sp. Naph1]|uniref:hypothetical protein n=1 Tax=Hoeflea sp. Naph1 TaxID=3388653 RepID=UPI0039900622
MSITQGETVHVSYAFDAYNGGDVCLTRRAARRPVKIQAKKMGLEIALGPNQV